MARPPVARTAASSNAFDQALWLHDLESAAITYAIRHGPPGSAAYRAAWLRFRKRIRTAEDLREARNAKIRTAEDLQRAREAKTRAAEDLRRTREAISPRRAAR